MGHKVIICCNVYPPRFIGGAELIAHAQAKILKRLGHDVVVFTGDIQAVGKRHSMRREAYDGLTVYRIYLTQKDYDHNSVNFTHRKVEEHFQELLDSFSPDIVHFHNIVGLSVGLIHIAKSRGIKTILTFHDHWGLCHKNTIIKREGEICRDHTGCAECMPFISDSDHKLIPVGMRKDFLAMQLQEVDEFISPSRYLAEKYIRAGIPGEKMSVVWNGIDVKRFAAIQKIPPGDAARFTFIGYFGRHKGIHVLLDALQFIPPHIQIRINLVGDGELMSLYTRLVKERGITDRVKFWGKIDNIEDVYRETDVLILPSIWPENQPVTITEAMAAGIPVIASNIGGNPELIEDGSNGFLFEAGNAMDLAKKMVELISHPEKIRAYGKKAYERIERSTLEAQVDKIIQVYDRAPDNAYGIKNGIIIACTGNNMSRHCMQAMRSFLKSHIGKKYYFVMDDWLSKDLIQRAGLIWVVDKKFDMKTVGHGIANHIPLLVPGNNRWLKGLCIKNNRGLYYEDAMEAELCLSCLLDKKILVKTISR